MIQKLEIGTQRELEEVLLPVAESRKLKCIAPRHFSTALRFSGKTFRRGGKIPGC
jgi:hypothetical protein